MHLPPCSVMRLECVARRRVSHGNDVTQAAQTRGALGGFCRVLVLREVGSAEGGRKVLLRARGCRSRVWWRGVRARKHPWGEADPRFSLRSDPGALRQVWQPEFLWQDQRGEGVLVRVFTQAGRRRNF